MSFAKKIYYRINAFFIQNFAYYRELNSPPPAAENVIKHANPKDKVTGLKNDYERHKKLLENVTSDIVRKFVQKYYFDFLLFDYDIDEMEKIAQEKEIEEKSTDSTNIE